jgi:hypothetical protein
LTLANDEDDIELEVEKIAKFSPHQINCRIILKSKHGNDTDGAGLLDEKAQKARKFIKLKFEISHNFLLN